jgi:omega-amidase
MQGLVSPLGADEHSADWQTLDPAIFHSARAGIPVTRQRRFDVYPDVSRE